MPQGGYAGRLVEIDLTGGEVREIPVPDDELRKYVGGYGLGLELLNERVDPGVHPLNPENPLILTTGPLTGIPGIPAATDSTFTTLNAHTGFTAGRSHTHGWLGPRLKWAGFDGIVISGEADNWSSIVVDDGDVEIRDATHLVGKDTHETEDLVKEENGFTTEMPGEMSVATIGPAGENRCHSALIQNDKNHSASQSGVGTVMGAKKLKAIGVHGTGDIPIADSDGLREAARDWHTNLSESEFVSGPSHTEAEMEYIKGDSMVTAKNMLEVPGPDHEWGKGMSEHKIVDRPCLGCPIGCSEDYEYVDGPNEGYVATVAGGGETLEGAASLVGVYSSDWAHYLADQYDRIGFDAPGMGASMAVLIEAFRDGLIDESDTGGIELDWGDPQLIERLLEMAAHREGVLGDVLANGPEYTARWAGGDDAVDRAIHVKGSGMNLHDWRAAWGINLGQIVGPGGSWPTMASDSWVPNRGAGYEELQDSFDWRNKPREVVDTWPIKYWEDSTGVCLFGSWGVPGEMDIGSRAVAAVTGWDFSEEEARNVGRRIVHFERAFGACFGQTADDDLDVSRRIVEEPSEGRGAGKAMEDYVEWMVREVYRLNGWDTRTGKPLRGTLEEFGLGEIAEDVWS